MKECLVNKVPLVNMSQDDPLNPSGKLPGGQRQYQHGGEGYQQPKTFRRVSQSGQVEIKIEYLYPIPNTCNLVLNGA